MPTPDYTLMYVTDDRLREDDSFFRVLEAALRGGVTMVQLREKEGYSRTFFSRALRCKELCKTYGVPLLINDRLDIALAADADGVHLGQQDLPVDEARRILGNHKIIGLSVGNLQQATQPDARVADYLGVSPVFRTGTKTKDLEPPLGLTGLQELSKVTTKPLVAIGGITLENAAAVYTAGAAGLAAVSAISAAPDPEVAAKELKSQLCKTGTPMSATGQNRF